MRLLIQNGYVIDPAQGVNTGKNLLLENGRVVGLSSHSDPVPEDAEIFDATGLIVAPGFIDMHVHLREPGDEAARDGVRARIRSPDNRSLRREVTCARWRHA